MARFYKTADPTSLDFISSLPTNLMLQSVAKTDQQINANEAANQQWLAKSMSLQALSEESDQAKDLMNQWGDTFNGLAKSMQANPTGWRKYRGELTDAAQRLQTEMLQGDWARINKNYQQYQGMLQDIDAVDKKTGQRVVPLSQRNALLKAAYSGYQGSGAETGKYTFSPIKPAAYVDINEGVRKFLGDKYAADGSSIKQDSTTGQYIVTNAQGQEVVDRGEVQRVIADYIKGNAPAMDYLSQAGQYGFGKRFTDSQGAELPIWNTDAQGKVTGVNPNHPFSSFLGLADRWAYNRTTKETGIQEDQYGVNQQKQNFEVNNKALDFQYDTAKAEKERQWAVEDRDLKAKTDKELAAQKLIAAWKIKNPDKPVPQDLLDSMTSPENSGSAIDQLTYNPFEPAKTNIITMSESVMGDIQKMQQLDSQISQLESTNPTQANVLREERREIQNRVNTNRSVYDLAYDKGLEALPEKERETYNRFSNYYGTYGAYTKALEALKKNPSSSMSNTVGPNFKIGSNVASMIPPYYSYEIDKDDKSNATLAILKDGKVINRVNRSKFADDGEAFGNVVIADMTKDKNKFDQTVSHFNEIRNKFLKTEAEKQSQSVKTVSLDNSQKNDILGMVDKNRDQVKIYDPNTGGEVNMKFDGSWFFGAGEKQLTFEEGDNRANVWKYLAQNNKKLSDVATVISVSSPTAYGTSLATVKLDLPGVDKNKLFAIKLTPGMQAQLGNQFANSTNSEVKQIGNSMYNQQKAYVESELQNAFVNYQPGPASGQTTYKDMSLVSPTSGNYINVRVSPFTVGNKVKYKAMGQAKDGSWVPITDESSSRPRPDGVYDSIGDLSETLYPSK